MTINADALLNQTMLNALSPSKLPSTDDFKAELQRQLIENLQSQKKEDMVQSDASVEDFKRELSSMGAVNFLQALNSEKIEALMEKKKAELMDALGLGESTQPPLSGEERKSALQTLEDLLADFQKELIEKTKAEDTLKKNNQMLSSLLKAF